MVRNDSLRTYADAVAIVTGGARRVSATPLRR